MSPFVFLFGIELFLLPIDSFTFRVWEALIVRRFQILLPGPFYPNMEVTKKEEGDLAHHTKFALRREVKWITDTYGYRKKDAGQTKYEVVIIGDSQIVGNDLTQSETLSEVLGRRLGVGVYPLAPSNMNIFLRETRFNEHAPKILILGITVRKDIIDWYLPPAIISQAAKPNSIKSHIQEVMNLLRRQAVENRWIQSFGMVLDRIYKSNMLRYLKESLMRSLRRSLVGHPTTSLNGVRTSHGWVFFLPDSRASQEIPQKAFDKAVQTVKTYHQLLKSRGIRFIFLPIPGKETIYYEELGMQRPVLLGKLISSLKQMGIETVDTQRAFEEAFRKDSVLLYQTDDTHWNSIGVGLTADLVEAMIRRKN